MFVEFFKEIKQEIRITAPGIFYWFLFCFTCKKNRLVPIRVLIKISLYVLFSKYAP